MLADALYPLEQRARVAGTVQALDFPVANESLQVLPYRQALFWRAGMRAPELLAVSGLVSLPEDSPFTVWLQRLVKKLWHIGGELPRVMDLATIEAGGGGGVPMDGLLPGDIEGWREWWPAQLVVVPLRRDATACGLVVFLFAQAPQADELAALQRLQSTWSYCAWSLTRRSRSLARVRSMRAGRWLFAALLAGLMFLPVHQTALAPAEIVALNAVALAAPVDGVIKKFHVQPNQPVRAGQPVFSFDDTTLRNRREVSARSLDVAATELRLAQQRSFDDTKARSDVGTLQGRIAERRAELRAVEEQLKRLDVLAPGDGIAVFGDANDWQGRPVVTGERVMQLADPKAAGVLVLLPVADAIALELGARVRVFLDVAPLAPIEATLSETSYLAVVSPDAVASYRLRATLLPDGDGAARIGLKGTAKVYGGTVTLAYYLLRRPLAAARQWSGF